MFVTKLMWIVLAHHRLAAERDAAERDSREKETKILSQSRELEELQSRLADAERMNQQQQAELSELMSSKDDVGKNVRLSLCHLVMFVLAFSLSIKNSQCTLY